jgi:predicted DNA-binding protein
MAEKLTITPKKYKGETSTITTRLPAELIAKIDDAVKKTGRNRNDIVQKFIEYAVENLEITEE